MVLSRDDAKTIVVIPDSTLALRYQQTVDRA